MFDKLFEVAQGEMIEVLVRKKSYHGTNISGYFRFIITHFFIPRSLTCIQRNVFLWYVQKGLINTKFYRFNFLFISCYIFNFFISLFFFINFISFYKFNIFISLYFFIMMNFLHSQKLHQLF